MEPAVSVPMEAAAISAATEIALPPDDPPGISLSGRKGFFGEPPSRLL